MKISVWSGSPSLGRRRTPQSEHAEHVRPSVPPTLNAPPSYPAALHVLAAQRRAAPVVHGAQGVGVGGSDQVTRDLTAHRLVRPQRLVVFITWMKK